MNAGHSLVPTTLLMDRQQRLGSIVHPIHLEL